MSYFYLYLIHRKEDPLCVISHVLRPTYRLNFFSYPRSYLFDTIVSLLLTSYLIIHILLPTAIKSLLLYSAQRTIPLSSFVTLSTRQIGPAISESIFPIAGSSQACCLSALSSGQGS